MRPRAALVALFVLLAAPAARAQESWLVLEVNVAGEPTATASAAALAQQLEAAGILHYAPAQAARRYEESVSAPMRTLARNELRRLDGLRGELAEATAASNWPRVREILRDLDGFQASMSAVVGNYSAVSTTQLRACVMSVMETLETGDRDAALDEMKSCHRRVPGATLRRSHYPPDLVGLFEEARALIDSSERPRVVIDPEEDGCVVFLNGRAISRGRTELPPLMPAHYFVRVECDEATTDERVHILHVEDLDVTLHVSPRLDRAVRSDDRLRLEYSSQDEMDAHLVGDVMHIGARMGVTDVVVVSRRGGVAQFERLDIAGSLVAATVRTAARRSRQDAESVLRSLRARQSVDLRSGDAIVAREWPAEPEAAAAEEDVEPPAAQLDPRRIRHTPPPAALSVEESPSAAWVAAPTALAVVGAGTIAWGAGGLMSGRCIQRFPDGGCAITESPRRRAYGVIAGAGLALVAAGVTWGIVGRRQRRTEVTAGVGHVQVRVNY